MSSCIVLQQQKSIFIGADSAISSFVNGKRERIANVAKKLFTKDNSIIFCSGNMAIAEDCRSYIEQMEEVDVELISSFIKLLNPSGMFEIFVVKIVSHTVVTYQLSSYHNFSPIVRKVGEGQTQIFAMGYNTNTMLNSFEKNLCRGNILEAISTTFKQNICNEVGGNIDVYYYHNDYLVKREFDIQDDTPCWLPFLEKKNCDLLISDTLVGKLILSEKLFISNEDGSFEILPNGLTIRDELGKEQVSLGIDDKKNPFLHLGRWYVRHQSNLNQINDR